MGAASRPHTPRGSRPKGAGLGARAPQARRKARPAGGGGASPGGAAPEEAEEPRPPRAGVSRRRRPSRSRPAGPGHCPCRGGRGGASSPLLGGRSRPPGWLSPSLRLCSTPCSSPLPSPSSRHPSPTPPGPRLPPAMACGATLESTPDADPLLSPASPSGGHGSQCRSPPPPPRPSRLAGPPSHRSVSEWGRPLRRRLLPPHHGWDWAPRLPGWARELGSLGVGCGSGVRVPGCGSRSLQSHWATTFLLISSLGYGDTIEMA